MRKPLILGIATVGIALVAAVIAAVIYSTQAQSAGTNSPGFTPLSPAQAQASMSAANGAIATGRAKTPTRLGEAATLTAVVKPIPTCVSTPATTATPLPTVDASSPMGGFIATQQAQNASYTHSTSKTTDLAPQISLDQKGNYLVRHANCTYEEFLVANDQANSFLNNLPVGDVVVAAVPPQNIFGKHADYIGPSATPVPGVPSKPTARPFITETPVR